MRQSDAERSAFMGDGGLDSGGIDKQWHKGGDPVYKAMRNGFVRKVYGILTAQLFMTFGMIFVVVFVGPVKKWACGSTSAEPCCGAQGTTGCESFSAANMRSHGGTCNLHPSGGCEVPTDSLQSALTASCVISIVFIFGIICCESCSRQVPTNYLALFGFTLCESIMLSVVCLFVNSSAVGLAAAMTALVTAGLTAYACTTKSDFTGMGGYLFAALLTMVVCGFVGSFFSAFYQTEWIQNLYAGAGCLIFSMYIVYDTQLIVGGDHHKYEFSVDDYVFAALNIYLDIVNLFIYILQLLNDR